MSEIFYTTKVASPGVVTLVANKYARVVGSFLEHTTKYDVIKKSTIAKNATVQNKEKVSTCSILEHVVFFACNNLSTGAKVMKICKIQLSGASGQLLKYAFLMITLGTREKLGGAWV